MGFQGRTPSFHSGTLSVHNVLNCVIQHVRYPALGITPERPCGRGTAFSWEAGTLTDRIEDLDSCALLVLQASAFALWKSSRTVRSYHRHQQRETVVRPDPENLPPTPSAPSWGRAEHPRASAWGSDSPQTSPRKPNSPREHLEYEDAERPPVHGSPVALALDDFGGQVLGGPAKGPRPVGREGGPQNSAVLGQCVRLRSTEG